MMSSMLLLAWLSIWMLQGVAAQVDIFGAYVGSCTRDCGAFARCMRFQQEELCAPFCAEGRCDAATEVCVMQNRICTSLPCFPEPVCKSVAPLVLSTPADSTSDACARECALIDAPVCGSNGISYVNACVFAEAQCRDPTLTLHASTLCADDRARNLAVFPPATPAPAEMPECDAIICAEIDDPVCTSSGTMKNLCFYKRAKCRDSAVQLLGRSACEGDDGIIPSCPKTCSRVFKDPVCASNGRVYGNQCLFRQAQCAHRELGELYAQTFDNCW